MMAVLGIGGHTAICLSREHVVGVRVEKRSGGFTLVITSEGSMVTTFNGTTAESARFILDELGLKQVSLPTVEVP